MRMLDSAEKWNQMNLGWSFPFSGKLFVTWLIVPFLTMLFKFLQLFNI